MTKQNKTEKYIKEYMEKHYGRRGQLSFKSAAYEVLGNIAQAIGDIKDLYMEFKDWDFNPFPRYSVYTQVYDIPKAERTRVRSGVYSLQRGGFARWNKDTQTVCLTERGVAEVIKYVMKNKFSTVKWDGKWRIITFDIKEKTRGDRNYLRRQLRWIGFQELQKSVWVFPYEVRDELKEFIRFCKFEFQGDVRFMLVDKIEPDDALKKDFDLE